MRIKLKACFEQFLGVGFDQFEEGLANGIDIIINGEEVAFNSFEGMCLALKGVPSGQLEVALQDIITDATGGFPPITIEFLTCELRLLVYRYLLEKVEQHIHSPFFL